MEAQSELQRLLGLLAGRRYVLAYDKERKAQARKAVEASEAGQEYHRRVTSLKLAQASEQEAADMVRAEAVRAHGADEDMPEGVTIKQVKVFSRVRNHVDPVEWARENMPSLFTFDEQKWETAVDAGLIPVEVAEAVVERGPKAFIDRDLSAYLDDPND